jgi:hypothetical protein
MEVKTPSLNAVPDEATVYIDQRITFRQTLKTRWRVSSIVGNRSDIEASILYDEEPSYTGFPFWRGQNLPRMGTGCGGFLCGSRVAASNAMFGATCRNWQMGLLHQWDLLAR